MSESHSTQTCSPETGKQSPPNNTITANNISGIPVAEDQAVILANVLFADANHSQMIDDLKEALKSFRSTNVAGEVFLGKSGRPFSIKEDLKSQDDFLSEKSFRASFTVYDLTTGIRLFLTSKNGGVSTSRSTFNVQIIINQNVLHYAPDLASVWPLVEDLIADLGGKMLDQVLSRVDVCVDLLGTPTAVFEPLARPRCWVGRPSKNSEKAVINRNKSRFTGWDGGSRRNARVCIYDKLFELESKKSDAVLSALINNRWGGVRPLHVTRVEFNLKQILRSKDKGGPLYARSVQHWLTKRGEIMRHMVSSWIRFHTTPVPPKGNHRAPLHQHGYGRLEINPDWTANWIARSQTRLDIQLVKVEVIEQPKVGCRLEDRVRVTDPFGGTWMGFAHKQAITTTEEWQVVPEHRKAIRIRPFSENAIRHPDDELIIIKGNQVTLCDYDTNLWVLEWMPS